MKLGFQLSVFPENYGATPSLLSQMFLDTKKSRAGEGMHSMRRSNTLKQAEECLSKSEMRLEQYQVLMQSQGGQFSQDDWQEMAELASDIRYQRRFIEVARNTLLQA